MAGIYFIHSKRKDRNLPDENYKRMYSSKFNHILNEEYTSEHIRYGRSVIPKFLEDRFFFENDECIIAIEGIIYEPAPAKEKIPALYKKQGIEFVEHLTGQFSGFVLNKSDQKLHAFSDQISSKPLYYHIGDKNEVVCISSEGKFISSLLADLNIGLNLDVDSIKTLLSFGYLLDDSMPVSEIKKLPYGSILTVDLTTYSSNIESYFRLERTKSFKSKPDIIEEVDALLLKSVRYEWEKDQQYGKQHFSFLSGGLDSRVNIFLAHELGFKDITALTFAHPGSRDQKIAEKISKDFGLNHQFNPLDGSYLIQPAIEYVKANDGLTSFLAAAHLFYSTSTLNLENFGSIHSGQIGDVLFGSYSGKGPVSLDSVSKLGFVKEKNLLATVERLPALMEQYQYDGGAEFFSYEQRQFNGTLNGDRTSNHFYDMTSPFYNKDLIAFCLNISPGFKKNEAIYLDWFNAKHPKIANYEWQATGLKPTAPWKTIAGKKYRKYASRLYKELGMQFDSMNPFVEWFNKNPKIIAYYTALFDEHLEVLKDEELKKMAIQVFKSPVPNHKVAAVSTLLSAKLYLNELN